MLWTAQLFADGVCPDFEWHYKMAFAPYAQLANPHPYPNP